MVTIVTYSENNKQNSFSEKILSDFFIDHPVFTSLDFATIFFVSILCPTPNLENQFSVFIFSSDRVPQL
jgi:hypothetical protein